MTQALVPASHCLSHTLAGTRVWADSLSRGGSWAHRNRTCLIVDIRMPGFKPRKQKEVGMGCHLGSRRRESIRCKRPSQALARRRNWAGSELSPASTANQLWLRSLSNEEPGARTPSIGRVSHVDEAPLATGRLRCRHVMRRRRLSVRLQDGGAEVRPEGVPGGSALALHDVLALTALTEEICNHQLSLPVVKRWNGSKLPALCQFGGAGAFSLRLVRWLKSASETQSSDQLV